MLFLTWFGQPYRTVHFRVHYLSSASWTLQSSNRLVYQSLNQLVVSYDWTRVIFDTQILVSQTWGLGNLPIDWSMIPTILVPKCMMFCFNIQRLFPDEFICFSHLQSSSTRFTNTVHGGLTVSVWSTIISLSCTTARKPSLKTVYRPLWHDNGPLKRLAIRTWVYWTSSK